MKALILNEGYSDNLGDQAINESLKYLLVKNKVDNIHFQDFTKNINSPIEISDNLPCSKKIFFILVSVLKTIVPIKLRWVLKNFNRVVNAANTKYDIVIIGGGQLIMANSTFPIAMFAWVILLRLFGNKNIIIFSVGVASDIKFNILDKALLNSSLRLTRDIYLRDGLSQKMLVKLFGLKPKFVNDVAFIHSEITLKMKNIAIVSSDYLLGVVSFKIYRRYNKTTNISKEEYYESWLSLLDKNNIQLENIKLFYTTNDDRSASYDFKKYILRKYDISISVLNTSDLDRLTCQISHCKVVISARMHALILALAYGRKIITYPISHKLIEFDSMYSQDVNLNDIQDHINKQIENIISN
jgi:polysaccharide pyruvyl transferase WcaK-like protein